MTELSPPVEDHASFYSMLTKALDGRYAAVIDARSDREYVEDHVPGALNLPVVDNDQYAEVGTMHRDDTHRAYLIGVSHALKNISRAIDDLIGRYPKDSEFLVYCYRGGKRSKLWVDALTTIGYRVDRLPGGWKAYRAWVRGELERLPRTLVFNVLTGPTGCGKTRLLTALEHVGAQVLDLEAMARHRGSLIGSLPGVSQPSQKWFDSLLLDKLRRFDPQKRVWVESESKKIGAIELPSALMETMRGGRVIAITAPMAERVKLWREDYRHFETDPDALIQRLRHLTPLVGREAMATWERLAAERRMPELFQRLMETHYDPAYVRSINKNFPKYDQLPKLCLERLDTESLSAVASDLHEDARWLHHEALRV